MHIQENDTHVQYTSYHTYSLHISYSYTSCRTSKTI